MIETLDTTVRLVSIGAALLLLVLVIAGKARRPIKIALIGLLFSAIAYLINSSTVITVPQPYRPFVDLASIFTPFWTWLFGRRLFEAEPPRWLVWAVATLLVPSWILAHFVQDTDPLGFYAIHLISLVLIVDLLRVALGERADDLVEKRRLIRLWLPLLVALQTGGILLFETILGRAIPYPSVQLINAVLILALTLFAGLALLRTDEELLAALGTAPDAKPELSPAEIVLREKLDANDAAASGMPDAAMVSMPAPDRPRVASWVSSRISTSAASTACRAVSNASASAGSMPEPLRSETCILCMASSIRATCA